MTTLLSFSFFLFVALKTNKLFIAAAFRKRAGAVKVAVCFDFLIRSWNQCHVSCNYEPLILNDNANMFAPVSEMTYML